MASTKTLSAQNLETLGAARLAALLIEISAGDATAKRRLRLELAGQSGSAEVAHQVRKRLATIAKARSFVDWDKVKALAADLEPQRRAIIDHIVKTDPREAWDLMWRFMALAEPIFARCEDSNGLVAAVFEAVLADLAGVAVAAKVGPEALADRVFDALCDNGYGQYDGLIDVFAERLGKDGLEHLKSLCVALGKSAQAPPDDADREVIGRSTNGPIYADQIAVRRYKRIVTNALQKIAVLQGDVDGFIGQYTPEQRRVAAVATEIARQLLAAGRTIEAWEAIEGIDQNRLWSPFEWEETRCAILDALGRTEEAQAFRWACFARTLNAQHLRAYLKRLPDFDDVEAENRALAHALSYPNVHLALGFLIAWPALDRANKLVVDRSDELNGDDYHALGQAAEALEARYPLAATLLRRAMIDFALINARHKRYPHAARHLVECASLSARIVDYAQHQTHEAYHAALRSAHGRKTGFWTQ
ncbi:MAG: DUF6880 family protein [Sphingomonas sp.]